MSAKFFKSWTGSLSQGLLSAVETELRKVGMEEGERLITKTIDAKGINFEGDLKKSVTTEIRRGGGTVSLVVGPDADHAKYVLYGTRPHRAPFDPIKEWARRKLGDEDLWWPVWLKIEREGTRPRDFLTGPMKMLEKKIPGRVESVVADHIDG